MSPPKSTESNVPWMWTDGGMRIASRDCMFTLGTSLGLPRTRSCFGSTAGPICRGMSMAIYHPLKWSAKPAAWMSSWHHTHSFQKAKFDEIVWDVCLAYHWLVTVQKVNPSDIILYGISSGAGTLATRLMQMISKHYRGKNNRPLVSFRNHVTHAQWSGPVVSLC